MVKVVTDSVSDLPPQVVKDLGITVIPLNVHFGTETYRDGVDLTAEEFYHHLGAWVTTRQQDSYLGCRLIFLSAWLWAILGASVAQIGVTNDLHRV